MNLRRARIWKTPRRSQRGVVVVIIALVFALTAPAAGAATAAADFVADLQVLDDQGQGVDQAVVLVFIRWTSKDQFKSHGAMRARAVRTDVNGRASLAIKMTLAESAAVRYNGDWVNLSYVTIDSLGNPVAFGGDSRYLGNEADQVAQDRDDQRQGKVMRVPGDAKATLAGAASATPSSVAYCEAGVSQFYYEDYQTYQKYAQVGELHVDSDVTFARFTYGQTADSSFDVGTKAAGELWQLTTSAHVGNTQGSSVYQNAGGQTNFHWNLRSQFEFVNRRLYKDCIGGPYHVWTETEDLSVTRWLGGGMTKSDQASYPARDPAFDQHYGSGAGWTRDTEDFAKYDGTVSFFLGAVKLGARSGASTKVKSRWEFGWQKNSHFLYGSGALPPVAKRIFQETP